MWQTYIINTFLLHFQSILQDKNIAYYPQNVWHSEKNSRKQHCRRLMMQSRVRATPIDVRRRGKNNKRRLCLMAGNADMMLSLSRRNGRILCVVVVITCQEEDVLYC